MSDSQVFDLVVVSAFGRGQWLATELAGQGWKTTLADVTDQIGAFAYEDSEGPFGLFESQDLLPSQRARLADEGEFHQAPSGFALWMNEGPLEFRSELTPFLLRARDIPEEVETYIRHVGAKAKDAGRERRGIKKLQYSRSWLGQFAHALTSSIHHENHIALESESAAPLFSAYALRQPSAAGITKGHLIAQTAGVIVQQKARVKSVRLKAREIEAVELQDKTLQSRAVVWCLSYDETKKISESLAATLFPEAWPEAQWTWQRLSFSSEKIDGVDLISSLPLSVAVIDDIDLTWTRANMIVLRRRHASSILDAWIKVPVWMRRDLSVFEDVCKEVEDNLERRLPGVHLKRESQELSPLLWPVYTNEDSRKISSLKSPNLFFDAPGLWSSIDWLGRFKVENVILEKLVKLKSLWDAAAKKAEVAREREAKRSARQ